MKQVFVSHTKKDEIFCDQFDRVCARVGIKAFRSEFETISIPAWKTIKEAMNKSIALFFLVGQELVKGQDSNEPEWRYTRNWIAYEMGLACQTGIDVWAICDDCSINFPMPYINNYLPVSMKNEPAFNYLRYILERYGKGYTCPYPYQSDSGHSRGIVCTNKKCGMEFNLHVTAKAGAKIPCPQCLERIVLNRDFPIP